MIYLKASTEAFTLVCLYLYMVSLGMMHALVMVHQSGEFSLSTTLLQRVNKYPFVWHTCVCTLHRCASVNTALWAGSPRYISFYLSPLPLTCRVCCLSVCFVSLRTPLLPTIIINCQQDKIMHQNEGVQNKRHNMVVGRGNMKGTKEMRSLRVNPSISATVDGTVCFLPFILNGIVNAFAVRISCCERIFLLSDHFHRLNNQ